MSNIWIEILQSPDRSDIPTPGASAYPWQAMFACQVGVMSHQNWVNLKWGFNAGALFDEATERQKIFLESQHSLDAETRFENPDIRAVAFRYINTNEGLLITLIGKVSAKSQDQVEVLANDYFHEIKSTFPYDYSLFPATSRDAFLRITGADLLLSGGQMDVVQIRRSETLIPLNKHFPYFQGLWQSGGRTHEQIWRSMSASKHNILLNVMLRPTILYDSELDVYSNSSLDLSKYQPVDRNQKVFNLYKEWHENFVKRRLSPWKKFYYLQFHIVSLNKISENFARSIGTALTQNSLSLALPGYQVVKPLAKKEKEWGEKIHKMYLTSWGSRLPDPRLSEVADLDEVFSVVRIPYFPPGSEALGFKYMPINDE